MASNNYFYGLNYGEVNNYFYGLNYGEVNMAK